MLREITRTQSIRITIILVCIKRFTIEESKPPRRPRGVVEASLLHCTKIYIITFLK